jgi:glycosyltransferase involved in cell wall biosynthesis
MSATAPSTVEVIVISYLHAPYIGECLESILAQATDFDVHITVLDDCSADASVAIAQAFADANPGRVRVQVNAVNMNNNASLMQLIEDCRSEFVVVMDGDDYWIDPSKLQRQVQLMRGHPDCALSYHNVLLRYDDGREPAPKYSHPRAPFSTINELFVRNFIATCSVLYRRSALDDIPAWYRGVEAGDWFMHLLAARSGSIGYLPEVMAVYRIHGGGLWSRMSGTEPWLYSMRLLEDMRERFDARYHADIDLGEVNILQYLAHAQAAAGDAAAALSSLAQARGLRSPGGAPAALLRAAARAPAKAPDGQAGRWLAIECKSALPTSFVLAGDAAMKTAYEGPRALSAFIPEGMLAPGERLALRIVDFRGESNPLEFADDTD